MHSARREPPKHPLSIAIVGAGLGGLAAAATLRAIGAEVSVYEQASRFARIGAGIQMLPNSMKVLRRIGIEEKLRGFAFAPRSHLNREWDSGDIRAELPMPEELYGAPYLCMHRGDLHDALASLVPREIIHLGKKLVGLDARADGVEFAFADGTRARADAVVAADGVHSIAREILFGPEKPVNRGRVAYRAVYPAARLGGLDLGPSRTKWWGEDRHIVIYYTTRRRDEVYFVTSQPEPVEWMTRESWSARGDVKELCAAFDGFHTNVRAVLEACPDCHKWAILERDPLPSWGTGPVTLLGDACHPMTPYMAQGAATAIEDAAVLARCLEMMQAAGGGDIAAAFKLYEENRKARTARIQAISSANTWMRTKEADTGWLYGYDAWNAPLAAPA